MSWGLVFALIGVIIGVGLLAHYMLDEPQIKEKKDRLEDEQKKYLQDNEVIIAREYNYSDNYYKNNISWQNSVYVRFIVDRVHAIAVILSSKGQKEIIPFSDFVGCEIVTDSKVTGGVGRAIVGGAIGGEAGAIVGAVTAKDHIVSYKITLYKKDIINPKTEIVLINEKKATKDRDYINAVNFAESVNATIKAIINTDIEAQDSTDTSYKTVVVGECADKINLIKAIRELQNVSLNQASAIADRGIICEGVSHDRALQIVAEYGNKGVVLNIVDN